MLSRGTSSGLFCLLAFTSGITAQCLFGTGCKYACNCQPGVNCDSMTGCTGNCTRGFDGPKCQRQNVALDKRTEQQPGAYCKDKNDPDTCLNSHYAVDGKLDTTIDFDKKFCTNTDGIGALKWIVHLEKAYEINKFVIYNRQGFEFRLAKFKLEVGDSNGNFQECYEDQTTKGISPGTIIEKHCKNNQPVQGNTVRITKPGPYALTLCEVILYVCENGLYGEECNQECLSTKGCECENNICTTCSAKRWGSDCNSKCFCENGAACDKSTGQCPGRCAPGYQGPSCNQACDGYFGQNCNAICGNCDNGVNCDHISGECPGTNTRCAAGWMDNQCLTMCDGSFGPDCKTNCGNCANGAKCDHVSGECPNTAPRCAAGWMDNKCFTGCPDGNYGPDCTEACGNCIKGNTSCDKQGGSCRDGCAAGWKGGVCKQECPDGNYGPDCKESCGNCRRGNTSCDKQDGSCRDGCAAGWKGNVCKQTCDGSFGINCTTQCGKCDNETMCNQVNGECPVANPRCAAGWMNNTCLTRCPDGLYGSDCKESCGNCRNDTAFCDKEIGHCLGGCTAGWKGFFCRQECENGTWGDSCASKCSEHCKGGNLNCNSMNGTCLMGCVSGYVGETCITEKANAKQRSSPTGGIVGGVVGCIVVVAIVVVVVVFLRRRKGNAHKKDQSHGMTNTAVYANVSTDSPKETPQVNNDSPGPSVPNQTSNSVKTPPKPLAKNKGKPVMELKGEDNSTYYNVVDFVKDRNNGINVDALAGHIAQMKTNKAFLAEYEALSAGRSNWETANKNENKPKNRYRGIAAYDHSRVVLKTLPEDPHSDYINASFIHGYKEPNKYIASQGPTPVMINDFVRMAWEQDVGKIIMLTNLTENTIVKSLQYWPANVGGRATFGAISVTMVSEDISADYVIRSLEFEHDDEPGVVKNIKQFHFTSWPDHGVPSSATGLLMFRDKIYATETESTGPLLVHCSAGVGRTGTYIGLDYLVKQANDEHQVDVIFCVNLMRSQRPNMIQNAEQYQFLYESVLEAIKGYEPSIPSADFEKVYRKMCQRDPQSGTTKLEENFQSMKSLAPKFTKDDFSAALQRDNRNKNRNPKFLAADRCRVYLSTPVKGRNNYINAVFIPGYKAKNAFIITQTPLPDTVVDFWRLLNDQLITTVITLDPPESFNSKQVGVYWTEDGDQFGPFAVQLSEFVQGKSFDVRTLEMYRGNEAKPASRIKQYHCKFWPGDSSSLVHAGLFELLQDVQRWNEESLSESPILVHCLDGVSKSGMFCAIWSILDKLRVEQQVNISHHVKEIQKNQPAAVSDFGDFRMLHEVVLEYLKGFQIYSNFT